MGGRWPRRHQPVQLERLTQGDAVCARCGWPLEGRLAFEIGGRRDLACALRYWPLLRRSALTALVVGTILVAINQGTVIAGGVFPPALAWKIPLTYAVPFCVATWGALINSRSR